jgi:hypothetical protein
MAWTLVVLIYAGVWAKGDSVTLQAIPGWQSEAACKSAGSQMGSLVAGTAKEIKFVCIKAWPPKPSASTKTS